MCFVPFYTADVIIRNSRDASCFRVCPRYGVDRVPKSEHFGNFRKSVGENRSYLFRPGEFSSKQGLQTIVRNHSYPKNQPPSKKYLFPKKFRTKM